MKKIQFIAFIAILICLLIVIPTGFAVDNQTSIAISDDSVNMTLDSDYGEVLEANDYYFDASVENDTGNGSQHNPYKNLVASRINDNSIIHLASGQYDFNSSKNVYNVTIIGDNAQNTIVRNAKFTVSTSFTLINVTFTSSTITNNQNLKATDCIFKDSSSSMYGGAINSKGETILDNCTFINNIAKFGGAIFINGGILNITNSIFTDNHVGLFGGAICAINSNLTLNNIISERNKADYYGGAIYTLYSTFNLTQSLFNNNSASEGGALLIDDANPCFISDNEFLNNNAGTVGAVYLLSDNVTTSLFGDNVFLNNTGRVENDVLESQTPNMTISNGNYTLITYNQKYNESLPSKYDLRELNMVTPVKNQGSGGNCWAFATLAALESCILKASGITYDLSEENMKNLMSKYSDYGWKMDPNKGGYDEMGVGYLLSWLGPINESDDAYDDSAYLSPVMNSFYHVQNVLYINRDNYTDNDALKRAIMDYGAVATSVAWYGTYVNSRYNYYCYSETERINHAITIVGWDDNYSKSNFKGNPEGDGAWIIKNSWGTGSGNGGYYYVSYYDKKCAQPGRSDVSYTFIFNDTIKYDKNYQYDIPGKTDVFLNSSSTVWYKNVFTSTDNEYLAAVSTYFQKISNYTFYIYVNDSLKLTQSGISDIGYFTLNLNEFIPLNVGDVFEVVFKITVDGEAAFPISEKISLNKCLYSANTSFLSYNGVDWTDLFNLKWDYSSHTYNSQVACIKAFTFLDLINTTTKLNVTVSDTLNIEAIVLNQYAKPVHFGKVTISVNGAEYQINVENGRVLVQLPYIPEQYNISALYNPGLGFMPSKDEFHLNNTVIDTHIDFTVDSEYNPIRIVANVLNQYGYPLNCGNVTFTIEDNDYTVEVCNGTANITHIFKSAGRYTVDVRFNGFDYYNYSSNSNEINVYLPTTDINFFINDDYNPYTIIAVVTDQSGNVIDSGNVTFSVEGHNISVPIIGGLANLTYSFTNYGINNISAYFELEGFESCYLIVSMYTYSDKMDIGLNINKFDYLNVVMDVNLSMAINETADILIYNDLNYYSYKINITDGKGQLKLYNLTYGEYNVTVSLDNDQYYVEDVYDSFSINSLRTYIVADDFEGYYNGNGQYYVYLYDSNNAPVSNKNIFFTLNDDEIIYLVTDSTGRAMLSMYNKLGNYKVDIVFNGDDTYLKSNITRNIKINSTLTLPTITTYTLNSEYLVCLLDSEGKPLANMEVSFKINSGTQKIKTNTNGELRLNIELNPVLYVFEITNPVTGEVKTQNINVVKRITENKDITMYYGAGKYYTVKVFDDNGNIAKGVKVTFTINKNKYTRTTDSKGYASFKISQNPGKYTITAEYKGFEVSNKITVKTTLITKNISVKKGKPIKFTAKLLDKNGKVAKNKKITFKFKGKTYKVKTNKKGKATLKITKKYKKGKYTITTRYGKLTVKNTIKIK